MKISDLDNKSKAKLHRLNNMKANTRLYLLKDFAKKHKLIYNNELISYQWGLTNG